MARAKFVKAARKDYPEHDIKKGESYWHWSFYNGRASSRKHYSKTKPKPSQLTGSPFLSTLYGCEEAVQDLKADSYDSMEDFESDIEGIKGDLENLRDETQSSFDNMPEGLQQGDTGQLLEARVQGLEDLIGEFDGLDFSVDDDKKSTLTEAIDTLLDEVGGFSWGID